MIANSQLVGSMNGRERVLAALRREPVPSVTPPLWPQWS